MNPFVGSLMKVFATVTAMMTVTAGQPLFGYVLPDGRVNLVCLGLSPACSSSTHTSLRSPSTGRVQLRPNVLFGEVLTRRGCEKTVLEDGAAFTAEVEDEETISEIPAFGRWESSGAIPPPLDWAGLKERQTLIPPPDLILSLCHFTC